MPAKYSHVKKRSTLGLLKKSTATGHIQTTKDAQHRSSNPHIDRSISQAMTAVSQLERAIARILLIRYDQDIARLFSTRLHSISLVHLPTLVMRCISVGGPSWPAYNADCEEVKDFFRAAICMDMRQAGERVATKSVLWSYTALRHFAISNNVPICQKRGLHSLRLLPYYPALKAHLDVLESMPSAAFSKPPHLGPLTSGHAAVEEACEVKYARPSDKSDGSSEWGCDWREKVRVGYDKVTQTLWKVAREFDVRGYGMVLRDKLTSKWCDCGCSTDHLGEVCERTVREDEEESGVRNGKQREWDGRGSGVNRWETEGEEDIWEIDLDFGGSESDGCDAGSNADMTIAELMEWRYLKAEREKEQGNVAFRKGIFEDAIRHYQAAHEIEPELPHYQLNLAAAHLKLNNWMEAEKACTKALGQHRSGKGYFRRAKARKMMGRTEEAVRDLRSILKIQPTNVEAITELTSLVPSQPKLSSSVPSSSSSSKHKATNTNIPLNHEQDRLHLPKPKQPKPYSFLRSLSDDRKLKITLLPLTVEMPVFDTPSAAALANHIWSRGAGKDKGRSSAKNAFAKIMGAMKMKAETITYPSWDKYMVRRGD